MNVNARLRHGSVLSSTPTAAPRLHPLEPRMMLSGDGFSFAVAPEYDVGDAPAAVTTTATVRRT